jgi:hypothetical protein
MEKKITEIKDIDPFKKPVDAYITNDRIVFWQNGDKHEIIGDMKGDIEELYDIMTYIIGIHETWRNMMIEKYVKDEDRYKYYKPKFENIDSDSVPPYVYTDDNGLIFLTNGVTQQMIGGNRDKRRM